MKTSRSQITDFQRCPRLAFWKYHYNQTGIEPVAQSIPLVWGSGLHVGVAKLLEGNSVDDAVGFALESYSEECQDRKFDIDELESQSFTYSEGRALIEGFTRAWAMERLPDFLGTYEVLEVEQEGLWQDWSDTVSLAYRPDALLRKRNTGGLYIFNLKSSYAWGEREQKASRYNVQGLSEMAAVEDRLARWTTRYNNKVVDDLPRWFIRIMQEHDPKNAPHSAPKVSGIQDEIFIKGSRQKKDDQHFQNTFLVHPWLKSGITSADDEWGWKYYFEQNGKNTRLGNAFTRVNVWEHLSMKEWVEMLSSMQVQSHLGNPLSELFVTPVPHERNDAELQEWLRQAREQEESVRRSMRYVEAAHDEQDQRILLDVHFPQYRHSCFNYNSVCSYALLCFDRLSPECGLYQIRKDHHAVENNLE